MIDLKRARADVAAYKEVIRLRNLSIDFDAFLELEAQKNTLLQQIDELRSQKNVLSKEIPTVSADVRDTKIAESKKIGEELVKFEEEAKVLEEKYMYILHRLPNFLDETAALGLTDEENTPETFFLDPTKFSFPVKTHWEL